MSSSGYTRQSSSTISSGQALASAPVNNEFNQLQSAFSGSTGHVHDGSTGNGGPLLSTSIGITATTPGIVAMSGSSGAFAARTIVGTSLQIDVANGTGASANPTISIDSGYVGQSSITTLGTITTGVWTGTTVAVAHGGTGTTTSTGTGSVVLSASPTFTGTVDGAALSFTGNGSFGGTFGVTGASTLTGNTTVGGTLGVTGVVTMSSNATVGGTLGVTGQTTLAGMTSTGITNSPIGASSPSTGAFTTLSASGALTASSTLSVTGTTTAAAINATNIAASGTLSATGHTTFEGVTSTGATGTGNIVYANSPTLTTASLGSSTATTQTSSDNSTKVATTAFVQTAIGGVLTIQSVYPVGSVYISMSVSTNPSTVLGFGTWTALVGVCLVGAGTGTDSNSNTQTFTAGTQVGEYVHTLTSTEMPSHTHTATDSGHSHSYNSPIQGSNAFGGAAGSNDEGPSTTGSSTANISVSSTGGGVAHNNVMPVVGAYMWYRSA